MKDHRVRCGILASPDRCLPWFAISLHGSTGALLEAKGLLRSMTSGTARPPDVPDHFLFRPNIMTTIGMATGGTVVAAAVPGEERSIC